MKSRLKSGLVAFAGAFILLGIILPVSFSYFLGASSDLCLEPTPANQIKSIQISSEIKHRFFSQFLSWDGKPSVIRIEINPYHSPDKTPVLHIDLQTKQMTVYGDCECEATNDYSLVPFTPESISKILASYQAPHSPHQGEIDSTEVYKILKIASENDIRNYKTLSEIPLKHYQFAYIHPEHASGDLVGSILGALAVGCSAAGRKRNDGK